MSIAVNVNATGPEVSYDTRPIADFTYWCGAGDDEEADCDFDAFPGECYGTIGNQCQYDWYLDGRGYLTDRSRYDEWISWSYIDPDFYNVILVVTDGLNQSSSITKKVWAGDQDDNPEIRNMHITGEKYKGVIEVVVTYETRFYDGGGIDKFLAVWLDGERIRHDYNNGEFVDVWDANRRSAEYTFCRYDYPDECASVYGELQGQTVVEIEQ